MREQYQCEHCDALVDREHAHTSKVHGARGHTETLVFCGDCGSGGQ
jgi:hypothetical protein